MIYFSEETRQFAFGRVNFFAPTGSNPMNQSRKTTHSPEVYERAKSIKEAGRIRREIEQNNKQAEELAKNAEIQKKLGKQRKKQQQSLQKELQDSRKKLNKYKPNESDKKSGKLKLGYNQSALIGAAAAGGITSYRYQQAKRRLREQYPDKSDAEISKMARKESGSTVGNAVKGAALGYGARFLAGRLRKK